MNQTRKKDILRLIRNTKGRFLSLSAIIAIGVAFFVGVSGSAFLMGRNVDRYMDETGFRDIVVYSDYGFDEEDIEAISMISGVKEAEGLRFVDVFAADEETSRIVRVHEYDKDSQISTFVLREGRLPQNKDEAVAEYGTDMFYRYELGSKVSLSRPDDDLDDYLNVDEVTIVGLIDTPVYINSTKETSTLSNQYIKSYLYIPSDAFSIDVDMEVNVITDDGRGMYAFSDAYEECVSEIRDDISNIGIVQAKHRSDTIIAEAEKEYEKGLKEYEDALEKYNSGIEDGKQQLTDAQQAIEDGKTQIASGKQQLIDSQNQLNSEYASNRKQIDDGLAQLDAAEKHLAEGKAELEKASSYIPLLETAVKFYDLLDLFEDNSILQEAINQNTELGNIIDILKGLGVEIDSQKLVGEIKSSLEKQLTDILKQNGVEAENMGDVRNVITSYYDGLAQIEAGQREIDNNRIMLMQASATLESSIASGQSQIDQGWKEISDNESALITGQNEIDQGWDELNQQESDGKRQLDEAKEKLDKARQDIDDIASNKWMVLDHSMNYGIATYTGSIEQMDAIGSIFPVFFFLVAALVCLTTMTRMIDEERGQLGIMRALGYSKMQCTMKYLIYALSATLIGCVIGSVLGVLTFPIIIYECWKLLYIEPPLHIYVPWGLIFQALISFLAVMGGTTLYVCHTSLKEVPSQLMRPASPKLGKSTFIEKIGFIWNHLTFTWKVTIRNLIRYKRRFIMTVIGVGGCSALLVIGFGVRDSIDQMVKIQFDEIIHFDGSASLNKDITTQAQNDLIARTQQMKEVDETVFASCYSGIVSYGEENITANMQIFESDEEAAVLYDLRTRRGHKPLSIEKGLVISEKMSEDMEVSLGDMVTIESRAGVRKSIEVTGICEMYIENYAFLSSDTYKQLYGVDPNDNTLFVLCEEDSMNVQKMLASDENVASIAFMDSQIDNFNTMIQALDMIIIVLIVSSLALAFVVLGNLMNINISERQREIATLKVLGFRKREVQSYIYKENNVLTFFGALFGLPLGIALHHWIMKDLQFSYVMFGVDVMPLSLVLSVVLTLAFGVIVNQLMKKKLASIEMVESLKSVE